MSARSEFRGLIADRLRWWAFKLDPKDYFEAQGFGYDWPDEDLGMYAAPVRETVQESADDRRMLVESGFKTAHIRNTRTNEYLPFWDLHAS